MRCPFCNCLEDKVIDSRSSKEGDSIRRRRECISCTKRYTTYEQVIRSELFVIKNDGRREAFNLLKLRHGIEMACWKRDVKESDYDMLASKSIAIINDMNVTELASKDIGEVVMGVIKPFDEVAYIRFASVYRQFADVDEFINELRLIKTKSKTRGTSKRGDQ